MLREIVHRIRAKLHDLHVWYRRQRLMSAYAKVFRIRYNKGPGFTQTMAAYARLEEEGLATITEDGLEWHWPEEEPDGDGGGD